MTVRDFRQGVGRKGHMRRMDGSLKGSRRSLREILFPRESKEKAWESDARLINIALMSTALAALISSGLGGH